MISTVALGAALYALDRVVMGPVPPRGWQRVERLASLPRSVTAPPTPPYVPPGLRWPPAEVRYRLDPRGRDIGMWIGLRASDGRALWIGRGRDDAGDVLGRALGCLANACPPRWRAATVRVLSGRTLWVIGRLSAAELERVVSALAQASAR